jgi:hypothetical protein
MVIVCFKPFYHKIHNRLHTPKLGMLTPFPHHYHYELLAHANIGLQYSPDQKKAQAKPLSFTFDEVFTEEKNNSYVFDKIGENVVENAMSGYHGSVSSSWILFDPL